MFISAVKFGILISGGNVGNDSLLGPDSSGFLLSALA